MKHAPDDATTTKNAEGGDASDSVPRPTRRPPPEAKSYATPVGPSYKARLSQIDAEKVLDEDIIAARTKQDWASARQHKVSLRWWTKVMRLSIASPPHAVTILVLPGQRTS